MSTGTALPLSTSVTSLQIELSAALEMAVRDRMLVKELAAALCGLMSTRDCGDTLEESSAWDAARAALSRVPQ